MVAARDIFLSHGFEHASIEAVAARAGVKKDTIYKRYPDKRALLWAVLQERIQAWRSGGNLEPRGEGLEESLKSYAVALLRHRASAEGRIWICLVEAAWPGFELVETRRKALGYDRAVRLISREIQIRTAHDEHPAQNADFVAVTLMSMLSGWSDTAASGSDMTEQKVTLFAHAAVDIIMNGRNAW